MEEDPIIASVSGISDLAFLRLLHLADSALPIGSIAHSFGLETLVERNLLAVDGLEDFLRGYLEEAGLLESACCRAAHRCVIPSREEFSAERWLEINGRLSAIKPARASRGASGALGQRLLLLAGAMGDLPVMERALVASRRSATLIHHSTAFGLLAGALGLDEDRAALGYLHQSVAGLISACQRLLPLGQSAAARILWNLKPVIAECARASKPLAPEDACCFLPLLDWGAMEQPSLHTRLFMS